MARMVLVEFTTDTFDADGELKREKGDRMYVDPMSARSFVDVKKVAARVVDGELVPRPRSGKKAKATAVEPQLPFEPEPESDLERSDQEQTEGEPV